MHEKSIQVLNEALADELAAIHQYMYFHFRLDDLGYEPLSEMMKRAAIGEMQHSERIAERILFLGGEVEMEVAHPVNKIHDAKEMLEAAKKMEQDTIELYNRFASELTSDAGTRRLFEELVSDEESHFDGFDRQAGHIERFGERYLALQSFSEGAEEA